MVDHNTIGLSTYQEITSQTTAWEEAIQLISSLTPDLQTLWHEGNYENVVFTGCGSTYYLSLAGMSLWQESLRSPAKAVPAGDLYLYPQATYGTSPEVSTLMVAISRSGTTSETIAAVEHFKRERQGDVIVITNYGDTPLAELGDILVSIPAGQEESVAQTRSFASMYVAVTALIVALAGEGTSVAALTRLPETGQRLISNCEPLAHKLGADLSYDRFYFLGSGPRYGLACEGNLKMKEMTLTHSEPFHFLEFRHGPMSMVNEQAVIVGLVSEENREHELQVLNEMAELGGTILTLGEKGPDIPFHSQLPSNIRNVLYLPALQLMAYHRSLAKGLNPDRPNNLSAVVELDLA
ncbi:MAG: SIS domain-containing protein [Chloroflexi bacterium]|nr:SIS domain-containing protein [Chloroflexota bacterium]